MNPLIKNPNRKKECWICRKNGYGYLIHSVSRDRLSKIGFDYNFCEKLEEGYYNIINNNSVNKKMKKIRHSKPKKYKMPPVTFYQEMEAIYKETRHQIADNIISYFDKLTLDEVFEIKTIIRDSIRNGLKRAYELGKKNSK